MPALPGAAVQGRRARHEFGEFSSCCRTMSCNFRYCSALAFAFLTTSMPHLVMAQTNDTDAARWLANAEIAPPFLAPASRREWETKRKQVRATVWQLLGKLPPRPKHLKVETLSREDRGDYFLEKFQFDNGAGATAPGYLLLPKAVRGKAPAI